MNYRIAPSYEQLPSAAMLRVPDSWRGMLCAVIASTVADAHAMRGVDEIHVEILSYDGRRLGVFVAHKQWVAREIAP